MTPRYFDRLSRTDLEVILGLIPEGVKVLDLGCGDCLLLSELVVQRGVKGTGVDIDGKLLIQGLSLGVNVYQGDLDEGLSDFPDHSYDYVVLNQTLQVVKNPLLVLREMLRIGRFGIVGFPNFAHWKLRKDLFLTGKAPKSPALPFEWYDTPNIRVLSVRDFMAFCRSEKIAIVSERYRIGGRWVRRGFFTAANNLLAQIGLFVITRR